MEILHEYYSWTQIAIGFVFYLVWVAINHAIAQAKNMRASSVVLISLFFTPLLGYLYVVGMPGKDHE